MEKGKTYYLLWVAPENNFVSIDTLIYQYNFTFINKLGKLIDVDKRYEKLIFEDLETARLAADKFLDKNENS